MSRPAALEVPEAKHAGRTLAVDWTGGGARSRCQGFAVLPKLLTPAECKDLSGYYSDNSRFRSRIDMTRHGFGRGEYKYFSYPLPDLIADLRTALYPPLAAVANRWNAAMGIDVRYPDAHAEFLERCHRAGQMRPTPLLLQVCSRRLQLPAPGRLRRARFPVAGRHTACGARPRFLRRRIRADRAASANAIARLRRAARQGDAVVFAVHHRPVQGTRGTYRVNLRHGVSEIRAGLRHTLGIIFHDAA